MNLVALSEIAQIIMGQSPPSSTYNNRGEGLPFFQGKTDFGDLHPKVRMYCAAPNRVSQPGDILISVRAPVGPTNVTLVYSCIGRGLAAIRAKERINSTYLLYFLRYHEPRLAQLGTGSTFEAIGREDLEDVQLPLPPLSEQQRIAAILAKADRLRRQRRYALDLGESYLQSVFLELFYGDRSDNWAHATVESLAHQKSNSIRTGPFGSQLLHSEFVDKGIAVLGIDNAVQNRFEWAKLRFITEDKYQTLRRYTVYPDDILITIMGTLGRCAIVPHNIPLAINTKHLCCITLDQAKCLPSYLHQCFLRHPDVLHQLGVSERGAIMAGLNMEIIKDLVIALPPIPLQQKFAQIVHKYERLHAQQREAARQTEHLFQTLLHRAFAGEL